MEGLGLAARFREMMGAGDQGTIVETRVDNAKTPSFYAPLGLFTRDLSAGVPGSGAEFVPQLARGRSDLLTWSAVARAGALFLDGLIGDLTPTPWQVSQLPVPTWLRKSA
jgi:hypothetical protein